MAGSEPTSPSTTEDCLLDGRSIGLDCSSASTSDPTLSAPPQSSASPKRDCNRPSDCFFSSTKSWPVVDDCAVSLGTEGTDLSGDGVSMGSLATGVTQLDGASTSDSSGDKSSSLSSSLSELELDICSSIGIGDVSMMSAERSGAGGINAAAFSKKIPLRCWEPYLVGSIVFLLARVGGSLTRFRVFSFSDIPFL